MQQLNHFDAIERQREKQRLRNQADHDLRIGVVSLEELRARNGFFSSVDISKAFVRRRVFARTKRC